MPRWLPWAWGWNLPVTSKLPLEGRAREIDPRVLLLCVQVAALVVLGRYTPFDWGFPLDDAWIHQVVARQFARTGDLGFVPGRFASAATSVLWALVQSVNFALFFLPPALYSFAVNAVLFVATGQLLYATLEADGFAKVHAFAVAAFASICGNCVWFVFSGMEATLFLFLSHAAVWLWFRPGRRPVATALGTGGIVSLLFLTRPEAGLMGGVLALFSLRARRPLSHVAWLGLPLALTAGGYVALTRASTGSGGPSTLDGRYWLWTQPMQDASPLALAANLAVRWVSRLATFVLGVESSVIFWLFTGLVLLGAAACVLRRAERMTALLVWAGAHFATYVVLLPSEGHGGRYQPLLPELFLGLGWLGVVAFATSLVRDPRRRRVVLVAAAVVLALPVTGALGHWAVAHRLAVEHVLRTEVEMGKHLRALPPGARIASFDIGGIGFFADRPILDLGGIADPAIVPVIREGGLWEYLRERDVQFLVLPAGYNESFPDPFNFWSRLALDHAPAGGVRLLDATESPEEVWVPGLMATMHSAPRQLLLQTRYGESKVARQ